jgi:hypothetical protein
MPKFHGTTNYDDFGYMNGEDIPTPKPTYRSDNLAPGPKFRIEDDRDVDGCIEGLRMYDLATEELIFHLGQLDKGQWQISLYPDAHDIDADLQVILSSKKRITVTEGL